MKNKKNPCQEYKDAQKREFIEAQAEKAEKWLAECPKKHKIGRFVKIAHEFLRGELVTRDEVYYYLQLGDFYDTHKKWALCKVPWGDVWQLDYEAYVKREKEIKNARETLPHCMVISDAGSLRLFADGVELHFGGVGGDGEHELWILPKGDDTTLSLYGEKGDKYLCTIIARKIETTAFDCGDSGIATSCEYVIPHAFDVYNVTNGWKIVNKGEIEK